MEIKSGNRIRLTGLLSVGSGVSSFLRHSGQKLGETQSRAEVWHRAAEIQQVLETVSKQGQRGKEIHLLCDQKTLKSKQWT